MKTSNYFLVAVLLTFAFSVSAEEGAAEKVALSQLMQDISQNDYESFLSDGDSRFKSSITKPAFNSVVEQVGELIRGGYKTEYLTHLNQQGHRVHLWKIIYQTSKENSLARLVMIDGKVAGFWLQ